MTRRSGLTLIEVLTAIFIAGIGLLALLTLFPLGAMNMAQSVQDDRIGHIKHNATAISLMQDLRTDPYVVNAMTNPGGGLTQVPTGYAGSGYPVFIDPVGTRYNSGNYQQWVGGQMGGMRRCSVDFLTLSANSRDPNMRTGNVNYYTRQVFKWCTLLDDMEFEKDGTGGVIPGIPVNSPAIERTPRFSWGWVMRQNRAYDNDTGEMQCVIYNGRALVPNVGEPLYLANIDPTTNTITVAWNPASEDRPNIKTGTWLLDIGTTTSLGRGYFYRAVSVTETTTGTLTIEVQAKPGAVATGNTRIVVMDNVVEVTNPYRP